MASNLQLRAPGTAPAPSSAHPADSSKIFLSLLNLARRAATKIAQRGGSQLVVPSVLRSLLSALHYRDKSTVYHSRRVALICTGVGAELGWEEWGCGVLEVAGLLHDLGKLSVPDSILRKPGPLSPDESDYLALNNRVALTLMQACRIHPSVIDTIAQVTSVSVVQVAAKDKESINTALGARILAVADMYDSLTHDQVFRQHLEPAQALQTLLESERQLDRNVIAALRRWLDEGGYDLLADDEQVRHLIDGSAPVDAATIREANSLCHACSYLYLLESLYDGYYIVDADLRVVIASLGLGQLLPESGLRVGERWSPNWFDAMDQSGNALGDDSYPMQRVVQSSRPQCMTVRVPQEDGERMELELHAIPMLDGNGDLQGVAEILRNESHSKKDPLLYRELRQAASEDPLTGIANRGELETCIRELHAECVKSSFAEPFSIIFIDVDHFKRINDTYEHATGDKVLVNLVRLLEDELYSGETVGRYGGEEFLVVCPATDLESAVKRAERVRKAIQGADLGGNLPFPVTASFGVAEAGPEDTAESVLQRADQALFDAKRSGRNRTCFREPEDMKPEVVNEPEETSAVESAVSHRHGEFVHTARIVVCEASDTIIYKLKGFVDDHDARLLDVRSDLVGMQLGRKPLFGKWGGIPKKQPVELIICIGSEVTTGRSATRRVQMDITVRPVGRPPNADAFQYRAGRILEELRSYLLAD